MKPPQMPDPEAATAGNSLDFTYPNQRDPGQEEATTSRIWTEAGFFPPAVCREAVELLHLLTVEEETAEGVDTTPVIGIAMRALTLPESRFSISDPQKLEDIAAEYGVAAAGRDAEAIARDITEMIIADYGQRPTTPMETP